MTQALCSEARIRRVIGAMRKEGLAVAAVSVNPDGTITVYQGEGGVALPAGVPQHDAVSKWADTKG
jgi:hypothetical protein